MSWEIDADGPTELNPPDGLYLVVVSDGEDTKKDASGNESPRKREADGCPMILFKAQVVMDETGNRDWAKYSFNIMVAKDDKGMRIMRRMIQALLVGTKGKMVFTPKSFNEKMAWVHISKRGDFVNCDHETWEPKDARKVETGAVSSAAKSPDGIGEIPF